MNRRTYRKKPDDRLTSRNFSSWQGIRSIHPLISANLVSFLTVLSQILACFVLLIGVIVLVGWTTNNDFLKSVLPSLPSMKANAAVGFISAALSILLLQRSHKNFFVKFIKNILALIVFSIGVATLAQYIFSVDLGIDQLFFREMDGAVGTTSPNRMAPNSALLFTIIGINLLCIDGRVKGKYLSQYFVILSGLVLLPTLIGYTYGIDFIYGLTTYTKIALNTATGFGLILLAILFARPKDGFMRIVTSSSAGGYLTRRLIVAAVTIPLIIGWLILTGYRAGLYDSEMRFLLQILASTILFTAMIWRSAKSLHVIDSERHNFEQNLLFLADASKILSASLDLKETLTTIASLAVPDISDWCVVDMVNKKGKIRQVALVHFDPKKVRFIKELRREFPPDIHSSSGTGNVIRTKKSEFVPVVSENMIRDVARSKRHLSLLKQANISSVMIVPILVQRKAVGAIQFISSRPERIFSENDLFMAQELASRTALAIENATLYKSAKDATKLRDEFISIASHELKTPITSLKVYTQILQKQLKADEKVSLYLSRMDSQIDRLTVLIKDLLDVSRIQLGKLAFQKETFLLDNLVNEVVGNLQLTTQHKIVVQGSSQHPVEGDKDRVGQVIINLVTNAIKYSPGAHEIIVTISQENKRVVVSVQDFGIGIDQAHLNRVFDRFYQIKDPKQRSYQGLGMGLYISREIIRRHGDDLKVVSRKGKGSTFSFGLPITEKE